MWGRTGELNEARAALLASNGFAALVVAYCRFKDFPAADKYITLDLCLTLSVQLIG